MPTTNRKTGFKIDIGECITWTIFAAAVIFVFVMWHQWPSRMKAAMGRAKIADWEKPGQFGDTYGAINALFSGLAFAGVIATVLLQRRELKLQRDELQEARKVQERSQEALSTQAHSLLIAAHLNALKARIEVYDVQIAEVAQRNDGARANSLRVERQSQWEELDDILKIAAHEQRKYAAIGTEPDPAAGLHEVAQ